MTYDAGFKAKLLKALAKAGASPFSGVAYRLTQPEYAAPEQVLSGLGAARRGGRYNRVGVPAVYLTENAASAALEIGYGLSHGGTFQGAPVETRVLIAVRFVLQRVFRLDEAFFSLAELTRDALTQPGWRMEVANRGTTLTWEIADAAQALNAEALVVPSAVNPHVFNLVIYPGALLSDSHLEPSPFDPS